jgi:hypothetical protein
MPKILPTFAAIAIIGVCIAYNTIRYPVVWEMTGPNVPQATTEYQPLPEVARPEQTASTTPPTQNVEPSPAPTPATEVTFAKSDAPPAASDLPPQSTLLTQAVPISLPATDVAAGDTKPANEKVEVAEKTQQPEAAKPSPDDDFVRPPARLVPVSGDRFSVTTSGNPGEVRRLPPVELETAPAAPYASEYSSTAIPIYPSTGK